MSNTIYSKHFLYYVVYETCCIVNQMTYIGCHATDNLDDGYIGSGKHLKRAIKKYGKENFKRNIIQIFNDPVKMFSLESSLVTEEYVKDPNTYNLVVGGFGGFKVQDINEWKLKLKESSSKRANKTPALGLQHTDETKKKISESNKGRPAWNKGLPGTWVGKVHTQASKDKISKNRSGITAGNKNPMYGKSAVIGRKWFNDGTKTFYLYPDDPLILNLIVGRLKKPSS